MLERPVLEPSGCGREREPTNPKWTNRRSEEDLRLWRERGLSGSMLKSSGNLVAVDRRRIHPISPRASVGMVSFPCNKPSFNRAAAYQWVKWTLRGDHQLRSPQHRRAQHRNNYKHSVKKDSILSPGWPYRPVHAYSCTLHDTAQHHYRISQHNVQNYFTVPCPSSSQSWCWLILACLPSLLGCKETKVYSHPRWNLGCIAHIETKLLRSIGPLTVQHKLAVPSSILHKNRGEYHKASTLALRNE